MQPRFTAEEVTGFLRDLFSISPDGTLTALPSYEDQNYKFKVSILKCFVFWFGQTYPLNAAQGTRLCCKDV